MGGSHLFGHSTEPSQIRPKSLHPFTVTETKPYHVTRAQYNLIGNVVSGLSFTVRPKLEFSDNAPDTPFCVHRRGIWGLLIQRNQQGHSDHLPVNYKLSTSIYAIYCLIYKFSTNLQVLPQSASNIIHKLYVVSWELLV